ncbi:MAG: hypothetical protein V1856_03605 [Candidatus Liptonbacteria bacterium]
MDSVLHGWLVWAVSPRNPDVVVAILPEGARVCKRHEQVILPLAKVETAELPTGGFRQVVLAPSRQRAGEKAVSMAQEIRSMDGVMEVSLTSRHVQVFRPLGTRGSRWPTSVANKIAEVMEEKTGARLTPRRVQWSWVEMVLREEERALFV